MKRVKISDWSVASPRRDGLRIAIDGVLLLLTLWGTVFTLLAVYNVGADGLWLGSVCLLLTALYLFIFSWPRAMLPGVLAAAVLWGAALWYARDAFLAGAAQIAYSVCAVLSEVFEVGVPVVDDLPASEVRELATNTLLLAAVPMAGLLGWGVVRARSPSFVIALTLPLILPALLADVLPPWLPMMALVFSCCLLILASLTARHDPRGSARFTLLCMPAVALLLIGISLLLPEEYHAPRWTQSLRARTEDVAASLMDGDVMDAILPGSRVQDAVRLDNVGPRRPSGRKVFSVDGDTPGRVYLRGGTYARYTGSAWEPLDEEEYKPIGLDGDEPLIRGFSPLNFPAITDADRSYSELRIDYGNSLSDCMYVPYQLATAPDEVDGVRFHNDSFLSRSFGVREKNLYYRPHASPAAALPLAGSAARAEAAYRNFVYDHYLELPEGFQQTADRWEEQLIALVGNNPYIMSRASQFWTDSDYMPQPYGDQLLLADWFALLLELSASYDLDAPYTPADEDFVAYFLNESRRGYCVHFASAGVLLMRSNGVPARYVEGYTAVVPRSGTVDVTDEAAHAWVEIYLDGYGWYPVDMTPSDGTGIEPHSALVNPAKPDEPEPEPGPETPPEAERPDTEPPEKPDQDKSPQQKEPPASKDDAPKQDHAETGPRSVLWLWIPLILLALAILPAQSALRRELLDRRLNAPDHTKAVVAAYGFLERLSRWGGAIEPEALELAQKARFSQHPIDAQEHAAMLALAEVQRARVWAGLPAWKRVLFWLSGL